MDRIQLFDKIKGVLQKSRNMMCIDSTLRTITPNVHIRQRIGSDSVNGEAYKACFSTEAGGCGCDTLAIKLIPLTKEESKFVDRGNTKEGLTQSVWAELTVLELCNHLVLNRICPNLPMIFRQFVCHSCRFDNKKVVDRMEKEYKRRDTIPCVITLNEYADLGDLQHFLDDDIGAGVWHSAFFQIFAGLYALQKYFDITHHDLHWGNVLVRKVQPGGYWKYTIDGRDYYCPNKGYQFLIWDFGYVQAPDKIEIPSLGWHHAEELPRTKRDYLKISNAPIWQLKHYRGDIKPVPEIHTRFWQAIQALYLDNTPLSRVIVIMFESYRTKVPKDAIIESYSMDAPITTLPAKLQRLIRDPRLLRVNVTQPYVPLDENDDYPQPEDVVEAAVDGDKPSFVKFGTDSAQKLGEGSPSPKRIPRLPDRPAPPPPILSLGV